MKSTVHPPAHEAKKLWNQVSPDGARCAAPSYTLPAVALSTFSTSEHLDLESNSTAIILAVHSSTTLW